MLAGQKHKTVDAVFETFDYNGNGILSLAEIDKAVIQVLPAFEKDKPAIMRAYKAADVSQDGFVNKKEFEKLLDLLVYYHELFDMFAKMDKDKDRRITFDEFKKGYHLVTKNVKLSEGELRKVFDKIDSNHGGMILFEEFCIYMATMKHGDLNHYKQ